jgi:hypothetical protein
LNKIKVCRLELIFFLSLSYDGEKLDYLLFAPIRKRIFCFACLYVVVFFFFD